MYVGEEAKKVDVPNDNERRDEHNPPKHHATPLPEREDSPPLLPQMVVVDGKDNEKHDRRNELQHDTGKHDVAPHLERVVVVRDSCDRTSRGLDHEGDEVDGDEEPEVGARFETGEEGGVLMSREGAEEGVWGRQEALVGAVGVRRRHERTEGGGEEGRSDLSSEKEKSETARNGDEGEDNAQ